MSQTLSKQLRFAFKGINRSFAYQSGPEFTAVDALNVVPRDTGVRRLRGGSRPGLALFAAKGSSHPVRCTWTGHFVTGDKWDYDEDVFDAPSMSNYSALTNYTTSTTPSITHRVAYAETTARSFVVRTPTDFNSSAAYRISLTIVPYGGSHGATYRVITNATNYATCHYVYFTIDADGDWTVNLYNRSAGVDGAAVATASGSDGVAMLGDLEVEVSGGVTTVYWRKTSIVSASLSGGSTFGVAMEPGTNRAVLKRVSVQYYHVNDFDRNRPRTLVVQNGKLYRDTWIGYLSDASVLRTFANDRKIFVGQYGNTALFNDRSEPIASGIDGTLGSGSFDDAAGTNWSTLFSGKKVQDYVVHITSATGAGTYSILAVSSTTITISGGSTATPCTWRIERSPKRSLVPELDKPVIVSGADGIVSGSNTFDDVAANNWATLLANRTVTDYAVEILSAGVVIAEYPIISASSTAITIANGSNATGLTYRIVSKYKLTEWRATSGTLPVGCSILCTHLGRQFLAGDPLNPNELYASAINDPYDWAFGTEPADAFKASSSDLANIIGSPITALIPFGDEQLLIGTTDSVCRMIGDPTGGGSMDAASRTVGIASSTSWCYGTETECYFLSFGDGIYAATLPCPNCQVVRMSGEVLPDEFHSINPALVDISMRYDVVRRWVHIWFTPKAGSAAAMAQPTHWIFDVEGKGYFQVQYASNNHCPTDVCWYPGLSTEDRCVLMGTYGGDLIRYSDWAENDLGQTITSYVQLGPVMLAANGDAGMLTDLIPRIPADSANVTARLRVAKTADTSVSGSYKEFTFTAGSTYRKNAGRSGGAFTLELRGTGRPWWMETVDCIIEPVGMLR